MAVTATLECGCRRSLPPLHRSAKLGWRACCGFASVHRLPRPRGYIPAHVETRTVSSGSPPFQLKSCVLRRGRACRAAHSVGQEWAGSAFSWIENPTVSCVQSYIRLPRLEEKDELLGGAPRPAGHHTSQTGNPSNQANIEGNGTGAGANRRNVLDA
jgi:hypothetical protein